MFGKLYNYDGVNYKLFCYKGSIHKFKFEFTICDECEAGSSNVSTASEANELDRVVGVLLCQAQDHSRAVKSIKTASFLITVVKKPWTIGRRVGFRLSGRELKIHDVMFIVKVVSKHRKQHAPKFLRETEPRRNLTDVPVNPECQTAAKVVQAGRARKQDKNERPVNMEYEETDADCLQKGNERKRKMARELPPLCKKSPSYSVGGEIPKNPVHPPGHPGPDAYSPEVLRDGGISLQRLRKTSQRASGKERASCHTKTRSSESSPSKQSLLRKATHGESSGGVGLRKSPRRCARRPHILPSTSSGKEEQLRASASSSEARQTRSMSLRKDDDLYLVHPKGDEFVRREYEKEETRLRNLAKPVTSSPERQSFLKSL